MFAISPRPAVTRRRSARAAVALLIAGALVLVALLAASGIAQAHANLDRAEPAPNSTLPTAPRIVRAWFTEPLLAGGSALEVLDVTGRRVDLGDSRIDLADSALMTVGLPPLPDGTYTVAWRNTSTADGHPLRGTYAFTVGVHAGGAVASTASSAAVSGVSPLDPFVRWAAFAGLLVALGVEWFALVVLAPVRARRDLRGTVELDRRVTGAALALFAVASLAHLALQWGDSSIGALLVDSRWGQMWLLRALLAGLAALAWWRAGASHRGRIATLALLAGAVSTFAFASHAAGLRDLEVTAVANDLLHTLAAGVWLGGLVALLVVVRASSALEPPPRRAFLGAVTGRFSPHAMLATGVLLITGLYASWLHVAAWAALATPYGWAVIAKVVAYLALILVAAVNLLWITRRLREPQRESQRDATRTASATRSASTLLGVTVAVEVMLVLGALLAAGFLTSLQPAREAFGNGGQRAEATSGAVRIEVAVSPASLGANRLEVRVTDRGRPLADGASSVGLRMTYTGADLGSTEVALQRDASGAYVADGVVLSLQGTWQFDVAVSGGGLFDTQGAVRLPIAPAGVTGLALPAQSTALLAAGWQVGLLALLLLVVAEVSWKGTRTRQVANWTGTALVVMAIVLVYGVGHLRDGASTPASSRANPVLSSDESIALGRALFAQHCAACHGPLGLGDGPAAAGLNPPPAVLPLHVPLHSDGDLFGFIEGGFPGSAMPAFKGTLTEEQMWHLVNYLRTLKRPGQP